MPKATAQQTGIAPCGIIAWHTLGLLSAIEKEEHQILERTQRDDLAALLQEAALTLLGTSQRMRFTPIQAEALRYIQAKQPKHPAKN